VGDSEPENVDYFKKIASKSNIKPLRWGERKKRNNPTGAWGQFLYRSASEQPGKKGKADSIENNCRGGEDRFEQKCLESRISVIIGMIGKLPAKGFEKQ